MLRNVPAKRGVNRPEEIPGRLDVIWQLHEAVLGVDAPVDRPGRRPATGGRSRIPHLHGERRRHPPLQYWGFGTGAAAWISLFSCLALLWFSRAWRESLLLVRWMGSSYGGEKVGAQFKARVTSMPELDADFVHY
jgi:hypothetical protein